MKHGRSKRSRAVEEALESELSELMFRSTGQRPQSVSCTFVTTQDLAILIRSVAAPCERLLLSRGCVELVHEFRKGINIAFKRRACARIEQLIDAEIYETSVTRQTDTDWLGLFVLFRIKDPPPAPERPG